MKCIYVIMLHDNMTKVLFNSNAEDMVNNTHAYFEKKINTQTKFRLGLMLEKLNSTPCHHLTHLV
jgi:hypothetical protein